MSGRWRKALIGSPKLIINVATGIVVQRMDYDEFGNVIYDSNPGFQPFGFVGGMYDPETKIVKFGVRNYNGNAGNWLERDPIGFSGGYANLREYVYDDPINFSDPVGTHGGGKIPYTSQELYDMAMKAQPLPPSNNPPYQPGDQLWGVIANYMYEYGGDNAWGNTVRGILIYYYQAHVDPSTAHYHAYWIASNRVGVWNTVLGGSKALVQGTLFQYLRQIITGGISMETHYADP